MVATQQTMPIGPTSAEPTSAGRRGRRSAIGLTAIVLATGAAVGTVDEVGASTAPPAPATADADYADPALWLCRPDRADDFCDADLDATTVGADGTLTVEPFAADPAAPIDCFYVYPTISTDTDPVSDLIPDPEAEGFVVQNQAAALATSCRVFAPVYRQITLAGLGSAMAGEGLPDGAAERGYADVVAAWHHYLEADNDGRGVVLIGHSQGASVLTRLLAEEIEPDPNQHELLVAAYLAGTSVQVAAAGDEAGAGTFAATPPCASADEFGCVVSWSSYRASPPPPASAVFGAPGDTTAALCVNPAALLAGASSGPVELGARMPSTAEAGILSLLGAGGELGAWVDPAVGEITTPFVTLPGLVAGECAEHDGVNYLAVTVDGDPADSRADDISGDLTPDWGLHLVDVNLVIDDLAGLAAEQGAAWAAAR